LCERVLSLSVCKVGDCLSRTEEEKSVGCGIDSTTTLRLSKRTNVALLAPKEPLCPVGSPKQLLCSSASQKLLWRARKGTKGETQKLL
jgi:hypothetical protein